MASIIQRKRSYCVVYLYDDEDGSRKQKWETFKTMDEAKRRKAEIEYRQELGSFVVPQCRTLDELMKEYVNVNIKMIKKGNIKMYKIHVRHQLPDNPKRLVYPSNDMTDLLLI